MPEMNNGLLGGVRLTRHKLLTSGLSTPPHFWQVGMVKSSSQNFSSISISPSGLCFIPKLLSEPGVPWSIFSNAAAHCNNSRNGLGHHDFIFYVDTEISFYLNIRVPKTKHGMERVTSTSGVLVGYYDLKK